MNIGDYKFEIKNKTSYAISENYFDGYFNAFYSSYIEIRDLVTKEDEILDVGCGGGLLVNYLFLKGYKIEGFDNYLYNPHTKAINKAINSKDLVINTDIQNFVSNKKYDLIFMSNVIEHLLDWENSLNHLEKYLKPNGRIVFLFPNYNFPIEFHFMIPIILNKKITYRIFKNKINKFEKLHSRFGIWKSLNFVRPIMIKKYFKSRNYEVLVDKIYIERLVSVLVKNANQKGRNKKNYLHKILIRIAKIFIFFKLLKIMRYAPLVFHPFVKIIVTKNNNKK